MMRVVLDVNVLVSGFVAKDGSPSDILAGWSNMAFELVVSEYILEKAVHAWSKPYFRARYTRAQVQEALMLLRSESAMIVPVDTVRGIAPDEEDDVVLATAVAAKADYLVTGDGPFRDVGAYDGEVLGENWSDPVPGGMRVRVPMQEQDRWTGASVANPQRSFSSVDSVNRESFE